MAPGSTGRLRWLALTAALATYALIVLGGVGRASGAGVGGPEWPLWLVVGLLVVATVALASRRAVRGRSVTTPAYLALGLVILQLAIAGVAGLAGLPTLSAVAHLATSLALLASLVALVVGASGPGRPSARHSRATGGLLLLAAGAAGAVLAWIVADYPGNAPGLSRGLAILAGALVAATVVRGLRPRSEHPTIVRAAGLLLVLSLVRLAIGVSAAVLEPPLVSAAGLAAASAGLATLVALATLAHAGPAAGETTRGRREAAPAGRPQPRARSRAVPGEAGRGGGRGLVFSPALVVADPSGAPGAVAAALPVGSSESAAASLARRVATLASAYVELTKPRIVVLLLITTVAAMLLAAPPWPTPVVVVATLLGGALAAGGANAINNFLDRDIDPLMNRTRRRPLPTHRVEPRQALGFGIGLGAVSFVLFATLVNLLAAVLAMVGLLFYALVYTRLLKRTTPQNIVIGGAAGAIPPLVGWAATAGELSLPSFLLFAVVFFWTPPHFWSLALLARADYEAAGVPMLPIIAGEPATRRQILLYSIALSGVTLALYAVQAAGPLYLGAAALLAAGLIANAGRLMREPGRPAARRMFLYSNVYLALLFLALVADHLLLA